jgi:hypothetical protein
MRGGSGKSRLTKLKLHMLAYRLAKLQRINALCKHKPFKGVHPCEQLKSWWNLCTQCARITGR